MKFAHWVVLGWACVLPLAASAQWQWIDKSGKRVFSDQAPPLEIPEKNILSRPGGRGAIAPAASPDASATGNTADAPAPKASGTDKDLEEKARKEKEAEKAKAAAEAKKVAQAKADSCSRARESKATLDSGIRIARVNGQGEREILDDNARAAEQRRVDGIIASDCK